MENRQIVVLFGDSLLIDTVEASLGDNQEWGVVRIHTNVTDVGERLKSLCPDLVIFDWDAPHSEFVVSLLRDQPGIPLLGLDVTCSKVVVLSSRQYIALTAHDLIQVIQEHVSHRVREVESHNAVFNKRGNGFFRQ
jgi:chemotaxis response regulator CheB